MATQNTLTIINYFSSGMNIYVPRDDWWNCCDLPLWGDPVGFIPANGEIDLPYCRKDGHGCDGRQGQFTLSIAVGGNPAFSLKLDFDSDGVMTTDLISPPASSKIPSWVRANMAPTAGQSTYTLTLGPGSSS
jgi:hypothetical protein